MNPYKDLPSKSFWKLAVSDVSPFKIEGLYNKKFDIGASDRVSTAGSCFAQHIAKRMARAGFAYCDFEPPLPAFPDELLAKFNYGVYSARYCNIYTVRQLLQTFQRALGQFTPIEEFWIAEDGVLDQFRPLLEPAPFHNVDDARAAREAHYSSLRKMLKTTNVFIFTMGLTEAWEDLRDGSILPVCPGTQAGTFDAQKYRFINFRSRDIYDDFCAFRNLCAAVNPSLKFLLTVSPVPLTTTATGGHALTATTYSKSALRAVAGELADEFADVAYFPSYEIIMGAPFRGIFFEPNMRSVTEYGVDLVMSHFFRAHPPLTAAPIQTPPPKPFEKSETDVVCEEMLLEMYAK
ncbi:GSCFA domain-containing protein [Rhizobium sp. RCAM05350]|nr:GSCFA domain-containing protein [Rhizobium sp. RCAM05350]